MSGRLRASGGRLREARWLRAGLADQLVIATANAGNTLLAVALFSKARAGGLLLSISLAYLVLGLNRAFVGDVLLAVASRYDGQRRDRLVRNALATALVSGAVAALVLAAVGLFVPRTPHIDLRDLVWVAPFLPVILLHDTARYVYLSAREPGRALGIDVIWVAGQAVAVVLLLATVGRSAGGLLACWGLGAAAGATAFLVGSPARPWRGHPGQWFRETRHLSGWFTGMTLIGQLQVLLVGFLVAGQLTAAQLTSLRTVQTAILQPQQNLIQAMIGLLVPRVSRLAGDAARGGEEALVAAAALRRQTRLFATVFAGLGLLAALVVAPLGYVVLRHIGKFAADAPLAVPIALQAGIYLAEMPFQAALRAMHRGRLLFARYAVFAASSLTGLVLGAHYGRLLGAAWGLCAGAAVGFATMMTMYRYAVRRLGDPPLERAGE